MVTKVSAFGLRISCLRQSPYLVDNTGNIKTTSRTAHMTLWTIHANVRGNCVLRRSEQYENGCQFARMPIPIQTTEALHVGLRIIAVDRTGGYCAH